MSEMKWQHITDEFVNLLLGDQTEPAIMRAKEVLNSGVSPMEFVENCISPALQEVGRRFETLDIFLPEMISAAEIVEHINTQVVKPTIERRLENDEGAKHPSSLGKVCLATVKGDLHDIGKNIVALMLRVNGFEVVDMGIDVPPQEIVNRAEEEGVDIIGLSSLLTSCLPYMKDVVDYLDGRGIRDKYAVIIGGAAPTPEFTAEIKADAQGHSAAEAVRICRKIVNIRKSPE